MNIEITQENIAEEKNTKSLICSAIKRTIDIIGAVVGIIALIPLTIGTFIANLISKDKGPVFYTQNRIGKDGKTFKMYKFRSMVVGADDILQEYLDSNPEAKEEYRINKKLKDDPRVTKVGKFIRKTSIDEFPQFINVLKGEMSLVGPRPYLPREIGDMENYYPYIVDMKPGLTGLWQISGRNDVSFKERLELDLEYYKKRNIKTYIKILGLTVRKVVLREGAI